MDNQNVCEYCGQVLMLDKECDCADAKKARKVRDHIERARSAVIEMFGEECKKKGYIPVSAECMDILFYNIELIAHQKIHTAAFTLLGGTKVKLTRGGKGAIKVERSEAKKEVRTIEEKL